MMRMRILFAVPAAAIIVLAAGAIAAPSLAATRFAVTCITNKTDIPIWYQNKWADVGKWETNVLKPGQRTAFSHQYSKQNENKSPNLLVRFDSDLSKQKNFKLEYKLARRSAVGKNCEEGHQYNFRYERNRRDFIDLKDPEKK